MLESKFYKDSNLGNNKSQLISQYRYLDMFLYSNKDHGKHSFKLAKKKPIYSNSLILHIIFSCMQPQATKSKLTLSFMRQSQIKIDSISFPD